jgi:probable FeS assembly SUF system protein SufT
MTGAYENVTIVRDVNSIRIPSGEHGLLKEGTEVTITQVAGGTFTVQFIGGLARIEGKDADALGKTPEDAAPKKKGEPKKSTGPATQEDLEKQVWDALKTCYDPEIPVNIVDLGLIYDCDVQSVGDGKSGEYKIQVNMTLTAPGCGMGPVIQQDAFTKIMELDGVQEANVEVVWDPPWNQGMMTEAAKLQLGFM